MFQMVDVPVAFILTNLIVASTLWIIGIVIYRFYFHPLAHFPGPRLAIATYWYEFYFDVLRGARYTWKLSELHEKYGPIIRLNPDELHINDPHYFDKLYLGLKGRVEKPLRSAESFGPVQATFGTVDHELHRTRRVPLDRLFSSRVVRELQPSIVSTIEKLCDRLQRSFETGEIINLKYAFAALTHDVIYRYCFSRSLDSVSLPDFDKSYIDAIDDGPQMTPIIYNLHWVGVLLHSFPGWLTKLLSPGFGQILDEMEKISLQIEDIRSGKDEAHKYSDHPTVLHDLLDSNLPQAEKSRTRIRDEAQTIIGAGISTSTMTMIVITCQLVTNQDKRLQLFHELERAMPDLLGVPPLQDLEQLPYLTAVILEGLRMSNVSSHRLLRAYPDTTLSYGGFEIPAGTPLSMTPLHIHENPDIFPDPFEFKPERWLIGNQQRLRRYLVPFGKGKRACLGKNLAWAQLYLFTAMVFRRFDFELHNVVKQRDFVVSRDTVVGSASAESHGVTACVTDPRAK